MKTLYLYTIISLLLCIALNAQGTDGLRYTLRDDDKSYEVSLGEATNADVIIPETYEDLPVTNIGISGFANSETLKSITIPHSMQTIAPYAFYGCTYLTNINISEGVTSIGESAFGKCVNLKTITLPMSVTWLSTSNIFTGCENLEKIVVVDGNPEFVVQNNCLIRLADQTIITGLFNARIPQTAISIGNSAFEGCTKLSDLTIPANITSIHHSAFAGCMFMSKIYIPNSVRYIGENAFAGCDNLVINCQVREELEEWHESWNPENRPVLWGVRKS